MHEKSDDEQLFSHRLRCQGVRHGFAARRWSHATRRVNARAPGTKAGTQRGDDGLHQRA
jgi:hypothetical protein